MNLKSSPLGLKPFAGLDAQPPSRRRNQIRRVLGRVVSILSVFVAILGAACSSTPGQETAQPPTAIAPPTAQSTQSDVIVRPRPTATIEPLNEVERDTVEMILRAFPDFQLTRDEIKDEYQTVADEINEAEAEQLINVLKSRQVIGALEGVVREQEELVRDLQSLDLPSGVAWLAGEKLEVAYTEELARYAGLLEVTRMAQARIDGERTGFVIDVTYDRALRRLSTGASYLGA